MLLFPPAVPSFLCYPSPHLDEDSYFTGAPGIPQDKGKAIELYIEGLASPNLPARALGQEFLGQTIVNLVSTHAHARPCTHACTHAWTHAHEHTHENAHVPTRTHTHERMHTHTHTHARARARTRVPVAYSQHLLECAAEECHLPTSCICSRALLKCAAYQPVARDAAAWQRLLMLTCAHIW